MDVFRDALEASPDIVLAVDGEGVIQQADRNVSDVLGYNPENVGGMDISELLLKEGGNEPVQFRRDNLTDLEAHSIEEDLYVLRKDGSKIPVHITLGPLELGSSSYTIVCITDIAELRDHQRHLRHERALTESIFDALPDLFVAFDERGQFLRWSSSLSRITGYSDDEIEAMHPTDFFTGADAERIGETIHTILAGNGPISVEAEIVTSDGERILHEFTGARLTDDAGTTLGVIASGRDITDRKERERALQARSAAMDASIDGMAILNTEGEYTFVNRAHADIYGYEDSNAFLGESWRMCYDEAEIDRFESTVMPTLSETGSWRGEAVGLCDDGSTFPQELSLAMTDDERIICVVRDITDRKQREQELENQNIRLEEFARTISHDLRNPLNVAAGQVELAREDCDSESLAAATRALERSETLIDELLTLARQGERVSDLESVSLATIVGRCWQNVATADATLVMDTERTIRADHTRLAQLFENLIRNAIEHGGEEVSVTVGELEDGFYVADDGPGIPPDDRESVFESGYSTAANGTGFGLSIVSEIVDAHGWDVTVTESEGGGARFEITDVEATVN